MSVNSEKHPELVTIMGFIDDPDTMEFENLGLHLATCNACRNKAAELTELQSNLKSSDFIHQHIRYELTENKQKIPQIDEQQLEQYLNGNTDSSQRREITEQLQNDVPSLKAALHFVSHQSAMQRKLTVNESKIYTETQNTKSRHKSLKFSAIIKKYFTLSLPAWLLIPASGFASVLLLMVVNVQFQTVDQHINIASYQDNAVLEYRKKAAQPGIGFFSNARKKTVNFKNITITMGDNNTLMLNWPTIKQVSSYTIRLNKVTAAGSVLLKEKTVKNNSVNFRNIKLDKQRRYQWILTGETSTNEIFYATGGFVRH
ncbi:hypothetical protein MNBD_GAMMA22-2323 [hydrothermal vent metagenome]|uniref:Uncharacterized protein n=1 Tax=hydrothermal vent metagenome TaxID=652676 RepID=A0A3B0ZVF1_9ZZZZ